MSAKNRGAAAAAVPAAVAAAAVAAAAVAAAVATAAAWREEDLFAQVCNLQVYIAPSDFFF